MESQNDVFFRDTRHHLLLGDWPIGGIVLHPDLAVLDVQVNDGAVNSNLEDPAVAAVLRDPELAMWR